MNEPQDFAERLQAEVEASEQRIQKLRREILSMQPIKWGIISFWTAVSGAKWLK